MKIVILFIACLLFTSAVRAETNDGSSPDKAIKVADISNYTNCKDIKAEYRKSMGQEYTYHLPVMFGVEGKDWKVTDQRLLTKNGKYVDQLRVTLLAARKEKIIYFDVTEPYTKFSEAYNKQKRK